MKKKDATQISFGHKHVWTDTAGHAHRVVFDRKTPQDPKSTWLVLSIVTAVAIILGGIGVFTAPSPVDDAQFYQVADNTVSYSYSKTFRSESSDASFEAMAPGWNNELFLADANGVALYDANGTKLDYWTNDVNEGESKTPTAATFVSEPGASTNGLLLVAYGDRIKALRFSLERVTPGEGNSVVFSAKNGALGALSTVLTIPGADIRGLACSSERLFVADVVSERVKRYSWQKIEELKDADKKELTPDCELGNPEPSFSYPGLAPVLKRNFSLAYFSPDSELFVANSGRMRVDAFNENSGTFREGALWGQASNEPKAFNGNANPQAIAISTNRWIVAADCELPSKQNANNTETPIRLFNFNGSAIGQLPYDKHERMVETFVLDVAVSPDSKFIYALNENGEVDVWTNDGPKMIKTVYRPIRSVRASARKEQAHRFF